MLDDCSRQTVLFGRKTAGETECLLQVHLNQYSKQETAAPRTAAVFDALAKSVPGSGRSFPEGLYKGSKKMRNLIKKGRTAKKIMDRNT